MKFIEDSILQARKHGHLVCGDFYLCLRTPEATVMILCDGVGSGVYANVAAITCGNRLMALLEAGRPLRFAAEQVAESMNRARTEEMPFAAFVALRILPGGQFSAYTYENPCPIWIRQNAAAPCEQHFIAVRYEMIAESSGVLEMGDKLLLCTDGLTHAGLGAGYATGWGPEGVSLEISAYLRRNGAAERLLPHLLRTAYTLSGGKYQDDTSLAIAACRPAAELAVLTGPPANRSDDAKVIRLFMEASGKKIICGSSTTQVASRELGRPADIASMKVSLDSPPEYRMDGIDLITEGSVTLNQAMNLLDAGIDCSQNESPVFRLCQMLLDADAITFFLGSGQNPAHEDPVFRQLGVKPRQRIVERLRDHLAQRGKLVVIRRF